MKDRPPRAVAKWLRGEAAATDYATRVSKTKIMRKSFMERASMLRSAAMLIEQAHRLAPEPPHRHDATP
jgi:hypothetical protein